MRFFSSLVIACVLSANLNAAEVSIVAGGGSGADGTLATQAKVVQPFAVEFDAKGQLYFVEMVGGERLRTIDADGKIHTLAGSGERGDSGDNGLPREAKFNGMHNLAIAPNGLIYLADTFNNRIRIYDPVAKTLTAFAGTGSKGFAGDNGPALKAEFSQIICIALTADGKSLFIADIGNRRVRAIHMETKIVTTVAGNGKKAVPKDGEFAIEQPLVDPRAVGVDGAGQLYILERGGHALRIVDTAGKIRTLAGTGKAGLGGDGGPALQAAMNGPKYGSIAKDGSVLIADTENHQIRRYVPKTGTMELVAGTGKKGKGFSKDPLKLELSRPHGVIEHPTTGDIYIADSDNGRILKISK